MHRLVLPLALLFATPALAVPGALTHQGRLHDGAGVALTGAHSLSFSLYAEAAGGTPLWSEEVSAELADGYFSVPLGVGAAIDPALLDTDALYVELSVDGGPALARQPLRSVPTALRAGVADALAAPLDFSALANVPADLDDGDDDSLAALACAAGQVPQFDGVAWACAELVPASVDVSTLSGTISVDNLPVGSSEGSVAAGDHVHSFGQIAGVASAAQLPVGAGAGQVAAGDHTHDAAAVVSGAFDPARIPALDAAKIGSGTLDPARIPALDAAKIGSGTVAVARLPVGTASGTVAAGDHTHTAAAVGALPAAGGTVSGDLVVDGHVTVDDHVGAHGYREFFTDRVKNPSTTSNQTYTLLDMRCSGHWGSYYVQIDLVTYYYRPSVARYEYFCGNGNHTSGGTLVQVSAPQAVGQLVSLSKTGASATGLLHSGIEMYDVKLQVTQPAYAESYAIVRTYGIWETKPAGTAFSSSSPYAVWQTWNP